METIEEKLILVNKPYRDGWLRILLSLVAAHYILSHTHRYGFWEVIYVKGYAVSLISSFVIALILAESVHRITRELDLKVSYSSNWKLRTALQVLFGIACVSLLAFLLACVYFLAFNELGRWKRYLNQDFPIIVAFIIAINAYYFIFYLIRVILRLVKDIYLLKKSSKRSLLKYKQANVNGDSTSNENTIAFIARIERKYLIVYMDGDSKSWHLGIKETMAMLDHRDFFMINSSCIINRAVILSADYISSKRYHVKLIRHLQHIIPEDCFIVSQQKKKAFEDWI